MKNEDLFLEQIPLGPMENFVYMIGSKSTREVALVDPAWDIEFLLNFIEQQAKLTYVKSISRWADKYTISNTFLSFDLLYVSHSNLQSTARKTARKVDLSMIYLVKKGLKP